MLWANLRVGMEVGGGIISPHRQLQSKSPREPPALRKHLLLDKKALLAAHTSSRFVPYLSPLLRVC